MAKRSNNKSGSPLRRILSLLLLLAIVLGAGYLGIERDTLEELGIDTQPLEDLGLFEEDDLVGSAVQDNPEQSGPPPPQVVEVPPVEGDLYSLYFTQVINSNDEADHTGSPVEQALIQQINNTQNTLDIALYELNVPDTTAAIIAAVERGVQVRMVVDDEAALEEPSSTVEEILDAGVPVVDDGNASDLMHNKFFIFDSQAVWTGSMNITRNGIYNNNNNAILIRSPQIVANFQTEFDEMFEDEQFNRSGDPATVPNRVVQIGDTRIETYFSPESGDEIVARLVELMGGADSNIRVMVFNFTLEEIGNAIIDRMDAGVDVQGVFEIRGSLQGAMLPLACAGAEIRQDGNPNTMHHKAFIIDDDTVVMGSFNFSASARDNNNENMLIIQDPTIAGAFIEEFNARYGEGREIPAEDFDC